MPGAIFTLDTWASPTSNSAYSDGVFIQPSPRPKQAVLASPDETATGLAGGLAGASDSARDATASNACRTLWADADAREEASFNASLAVRNASASSAFSDARSASWTNCCAALTKSDPPSSEDTRAARSEANDALRAPRLALH